MDLFSENIDLVRKIVNKLRCGDAEKEDLFQAGLMGLYAAAQKYDPRHEVKFNTYATYYILGEIKKEMRKQSPIRLSKAIYKIIRFLKENQDKSFEEIARALNTSRENVLLAYIYQNRVISLNQEAGKEGEKESELLNCIPASSERTQIFRDALDSLKEDERKFIELRFFQNISQGELAEMYGLSQSKISRLEKKILMKMRKLLLGK